jgi:broad specificity phosphatase PhoE
VSDLVVVRHGRTAANARRLLLGRLDVPLDDLGRAQAAQVAGAVLARAARTHTPVAAVVSSPLERTRQTAEAFGLPVQVDERLVELDYGALDGTPLADVPPEVWSDWQADPDFLPPGCSESIAGVQERMERACEDWAAVARVEGAVVLVTHVSPLKAAVGWAMGIGAGAAWTTHVDPASVTRIAVGGGRRVLRTFNETAHLTDG